MYLGIWLDKRALLEYISFRHSSSIPRASRTHYIYDTSSVMRTDNDDGSGRLSLWSQIPQFVVSGVMDQLQWERAASATFRLVCRGWQHAHDGRLPALRITDMLESSHCLLEGFNGVKTLNLRGCKNMTDEGLSRLMLPLTALTSLSLSACSELTEEGLKSIASLAALTILYLGGCSSKVTNERLRSLTSLAALTSLNLGGCSKVTDEGLKSVASLTALTILELGGCSKVTDEGLKSISSLAALIGLDLTECSEVTDKGLRSIASLGV